MGVSVTNRISQIKQPTGGYLNPKDMDRIQLNSDNSLNEAENISPSLIGIAVDYLTRYMLNKNAEKSFAISLIGAKLGFMDDIADKLVYRVRGLDDKSIISACKLASFDSIFRGGILAYKPVEEIEPDEATISNIREMVNRSLKFFDEYGPIIADGFTFDGGYTSIVSSGDGDFITHDTLWDFKVSKDEPKTKYTLQLLMYYIMGQHSKKRYFKKVKYIGFYNPRLNVVYKYDTANLSLDLIKEIEKDVIGYNV